MNKTRIKTLNLRIQTLELELTDPICRRYDAARACVQEALDAARAELAEVTGR